MKVVVHAGLYKTGTTSFQRACHEAQADLRSSGILYPDPQAADPDCSFPLSHADVPIALMAENRETARRHLETAAESARQAGCERVLLSSEVVSSLALHPELLEELTRCLEELFGSCEYVLVLRDVRALYKSQLKQSMAHSGCDLSPGFKNLRRKLHTLLRTADEFTARTAPRLRTARYEHLSSGGLCNNLLRFCWPEIDGLARRRLLGEPVANASEGFARDLYQLMTPLLRALIAVSEGRANPYARSVNDRLGRMIDRTKLGACLGDETSHDEIAALVDGSLSTICDAVLDDEGSALGDKYPRLRELGLI